MIQYFKYFNHMEELLDLKQLTITPNKLNLKELILELKMKYV